MNKIINFLVKNKLNIIFTICLIIFNIGIINKQIQNDTLFTIPTGNYILENGINENESFTYHENLKYIKLRWAFDIVVAKIYNTFSFEGLYVFVIIISSFISSLLYNFQKKINNNKIISFILTIFIAFGMKDYLVCRAQIISYLIFVIEAFLIEKLLKTNKKIYIIFLTILSILLVNFHSSVWLIFFLPFLPYFAEKIIYKIFNNKELKILNKIIIENRNLKYLVITFSICLFSGFLSPLGLNPYTYIFKIMKGITKEFIIELLPTKLILTFPINIFIIIFIFAILIKKIKLKLTDFFLITGFIIFGKLAVRNVFIAMIFISYPISRILSNIINIYDKKNIFEKIQKTLEKNLLANILIFMFILSITTNNYKNIKYQEYIEENLYPVELVKFMYRNLDIKNTRLCAEFDINSYFEFSGIKTCFDSRTEVFCKEFSNVTILEDWYNFNYENPNTVMDFIKKYNVTHIALYQTNALSEYLVNCKKIYSDNSFVLYEIENK